jgi:hypothetical protein
MVFLRVNNGFFDDDDDVDDTKLETFLTLSS